MLEIRPLGVDIYFWRIILGSKKYINKKDEKNALHFSVGAGRDLNFNSGMAD